MKKVVIIGASGNIATQVINLLSNRRDIELTLFVRKINRLRSTNNSNKRIIEGNALSVPSLTEAIKGQDIVYVNLAGDLEGMAKNIVEAMKENKVNRVIFISSIGIYEKPIKPVLIPYRKAADIFENSGLDYTILRPTWFTTVNEVDYELSEKGEKELGTVISQLSLATLITRIIESPDEYSKRNLGVNKPNS